MKKIYKILPNYAFIPIFMCLVMNMITYFGTRIFTQDIYHYDFSCGIDAMVPFASWMIWVYVGAYVAWIVGFIVIGRESRTVCYEVLFGEQIAKFICLIIFIAVPTTLIRPEITVNGMSDWMTNLIYQLDSPDNLLPSIHCLESWICFRGALRCKKVGRVYKWTMLVAALLVFASTLMVKQHVFIDVIAAVAVGEIGLFVASRINIYQFIDNETH